MKSIYEKSVTVLGSTGSVGTQALDVCDTNNLKVYGICGNSKVDMLEEQIRKFKPEVCVVVDEKAAADLKDRVKDTSCRVEASYDSVIELAGCGKADSVVNSITGKAGLKPSMAVINSGVDLALANKETIVCAGETIMKTAKEKGVKILPVDSEHCAIFQCIGSNEHKDISKIIITASGGPFFGKKREELGKITPEMALAHPTWKMGPKITIDSATLMNKGFEVIEARYLFDVLPENIDVVVHKESIIHSMVEYVDKAVMAQLSVPDMRLCVQYALSYPRHVLGALEPLDLTKVGTLTFKKPDTETFKLLTLAYDVLKKGGNLGAVLNASNEVAVSAFLNGKISFTDIMDVVSKVTLDAKFIENPTLDEIDITDMETREITRELIK